MGMIVVGLMKDPHEARGIVRALDADGFELEDIDVSGGLLTELLSHGVPEKEAHLYAEGVRRGGMLVFVRAEDDDEAAEAAELMATHGAVDLDACGSRTWWSRSMRSSSANIRRRPAASITTRARRAAPRARTTARSAAGATSLTPA